MSKKYGLIFMCLTFFIIQNVDCYLDDTFISSLRNNMALSTSSSPACLDDYVNSSLFLQYIDASGKIPSGLSTMSLFELGNFDQCYNLKETNGSKEIYGQYCLTTLPFPGVTSQRTKILNNLNQIAVTPRMLGMDPTTMGLHIAFCMPSTCSAGDIQEILAENIPLGFQVSKDYCYSKITEPELTNGAIATISFFAVILSFVVISTVYDIFLSYTDKEPSMELFIAFSALTNGRKLLKPSTNPDQLLCLNGLRAISMMWVFIGHEYSNVFSGPINSAQDLLKYTTEGKNMWMLNAPLSVDTFFTLAGLVTIYTFMKSTDKGVKFNIPLYYLHRYLRLTPALGAVILLHANLFKYFGNGPIWGGVDYGLMKDCRRNWWVALLYGQNYMSSDEHACVPQSWYLSVDMQIFWLSPLVLYPVMKWPKIANYVFAFFMGFGILIPFLVTYCMKLPALFGALMTSDDPDSSLKYMTEYYSQTYTRFGPYIVGMVFGYYIYKLKKNKTVLKVADHKLLTVCGWICSLVILFVCLYGNANDAGAEYNRLSSSFFNGFARNAWGVGVCLVVLLCVSGLGGPIDSFLSLPIFQLVTKLSYCIYLVHYQFIVLRLAATRSTFYFSDLSIMHIFWADLAVSIALAVVLCLTFESPVITLEKYLLGGVNKPKKEKPTA